MWFKMPLLNKQIGLTNLSNLLASVSVPVYPEYTSNQ